MGTFSREPGPPDVVAFRAELDGDPDTFSFGVAGLFRYAPVAVTDGVASLTAWQLVAFNFTDPINVLPNLLAFIGVNDAGWSVWSVGAGDFTITRLSGNGVPARFEYRIREDVVYDGTPYGNPSSPATYNDTYASGAIEFLPTDGGSPCPFTAPAVTVPAPVNISGPPEDIAKTYQLFLQRVQIPWR